MERSAGGGEVGEDGEDDGEYRDGDHDSGGCVHLGDDAGTNGG